MNEIIKIIIVGGGFGGVYAARDLARRRKRAKETGTKIEITLINKSNYFLFTPLLHEVATGGLSLGSILEPLREIFREQAVDLLQSEVKNIDLQKKIVTTKSGKLNYDYLILATGAETNYYGIAGAEKYSLSLKNTGDAIALRNKLIDSCEQALVANDGETRKRLLTAVVVGGGATGVELAAEIAEFWQENLKNYYRHTSIKPAEARVILVASSPELLPQFPPRLRQIARKALLEKGVEVLTDSNVIEVTPDGVKLANGRMIAAQTTVWVAGVRAKNLTFVGRIRAEMTANGRLNLDPYLRVVGQDSVYALGDLAGTAPMLAQVAVQQGRAAARNIAASIASRPLKFFKYRQKGLLLSLGQWRAAGEILGVTFHGRAMWWLWRTVYLFNFLSWRKRFRIATEWTVNLFYPRDITRL